MDKKVRGPYVDGAYVTPQEEPVIVKVVRSPQKNTKTLDESKTKR